jgi:hypothetical protein
LCLDLVGRRKDDKRQPNIALSKEGNGLERRPDRYLTGNRGGIAKWRFQPTARLEDAFRLLDAASPTNYTIGKDHQGEFSARVEIGGATGEATAKSKPAAITLAVARAVGIELNGGKL